MSSSNFHVPAGGLPPQTQLLSGRAVFTNAYAVIPGNVMTDIVTSRMPFWSDARFWVIARPMSGFAESFSHYICEVAPGGGSDKPETDSKAEAVLFVVGGELKLTIDGKKHEMHAGGYAYLPAGAEWKLANKSDKNAQFHWIRKAYEALKEIDAPEAFVTNEQGVVPGAMPDTDGAWATQRFVDPDDLRHDMHVNIVTFKPGAVIPFTETHVMEHGLYVLQGRAVYRLNQDWVEVEAGDYMWLRAFCPQACYAGGPSEFRYLLYKNVHRQMPL
jgi:(S)-ureidoglycine aminohydrolase